MVQGTKGVLGSESHVKRWCEPPGLSSRLYTTLRARPPAGIVKSPLVVSAEKCRAVLYRVLRPDGQGNCQQLHVVVVNFGPEQNAEGFVRAIQSPW